MTSSASHFYLPDTNLLVHYARESTLSLWIETHYPLAPTDPEPLLSIAIVGEILAIAEYRNWGEARKQRIEAFIARSRVLPLEYPAIIEAYVELYKVSRRAGRTMGDNDLWIAATAQVTGATLLTTDKDFDHLSPAYIRRDWIDPTMR